MESEFIDKGVKTKRLSVIVPVYNVEEFLNECVDSILAQSYENMEIILVDDGSSDRSSKICDEYSKSDLRIITLHKSNGGLSSARNAGLEIMTGDYVTFVDSDDVIIGKDTYEKVVDSFKTDSDIDIVQYDVIHKYGTSEANQRNYPFKTYKSKEEILNGYLSNNIHVSCCDKIFKSEIFQDIRFPEKQISEDIAIIPGIIANVQKLKTTRIGYYGYRYREGSITNSALPLKKIISILTSYYKYYHYAYSYKCLRKKVIEGHTRIIWSYLSIARQYHHASLSVLYKQKVFLRLSIIQWARSIGTKNCSALFKSFVVCVLGPKWVIRFQKLLTKSE